MDLRRRDAFRRASCNAVSRSATVNSALTLTKSDGSFSIFRTSRLKLVVPSAGSGLAARSLVGWHSYLEN